RLWDFVIERKLKNASKDVQRRFARPDPVESDILLGQRCTAPQPGMEGIVCFEKECTSEAFKIKRESRSDLNPRIHFGTITSGASVIKDAAQRERIRISTEAGDVS